MSHLIVATACSVGCYDIGIKRLRRQAGPGDSDPRRPADAHVSRPTAPTAAGVPGSHFVAGSGVERSIWVPRMPFRGFVVYGFSGRKKKREKNSVVQSLFVVIRRFWLVGCRPASPRSTGIRERCRDAQAFFPCPPGPRQVPRDLPIGLTLARRVPLRPGWPNKKEGSHSRPVRILVMNDRYLQ